MVKMTMSVEKLVSDAKLLCGRLKEHDTSVDNLIAQGTALHKRLEAMKEYEEDINELNEMARHRPRANLILGLAQENSQIRELQAENRDLRVALEEHQSALELIMKKYREQVAKLVAANRLEKALANKPVDKVEGLVGTPAQIDKICEMAAVMRQAIHVDEKNASREQQLIVQLRHENQTLREILQITGSAAKCMNAETDDKETQTGDVKAGQSGTESGDSLGSSAEVADILRQLDLPEEGFLDEDTETESESDANSSMIMSTIKRGKKTTASAATDSEASSDEMSKSFSSPAKQTESKDSSSEEKTEATPAIKPTSSEGGSTVDETAET